MLAMRRRELIALLGFATVWPLAARAQSPQRKMLRVGFVGAQARDAPIYDAFIKRMAELGYQEGKNFSFDYVRTPSLEAYDASFRELAARKPDVMMAAGNEPALRAARAAAGALPIVFLAIDFDPVERGYVASMARPGGNITGIFVHPLELAAKRIELLPASPINFIENATVFVVLPYIATTLPMLSIPAVATGAIFPGAGTPIAAGRMGGLATGSRLRHARRQSWAA